MWYGKDSEIYTTVKRIAYPKPGSPNPIVKIKMVDLQNLPTNITEVPSTKELKAPVDFQSM